jgi:hypothetical protein
LTDFNGPLVNARQTHRERRTKGWMMQVKQNTPTDNSVSDPYLLSIGHSWVFWVYAVQKKRNSYPFYTYSTVHLEQTNRRSTSQKFERGGSSDYVNKS